MIYGLRGFGDTVVTDPVTGQVSVVTSAPITTDTVSSSGQNVFTNSAGTVVATDSAFASWLNENSTTVIIGVGALAALFLFTARVR